MKYDSKVNFKGTLNLAEIKGWKVAESEGWKVADTFFDRDGKWPTLLAG